MEENTFRFFVKVLSKLVVTKEEKEDKHNRFIFSLLLVHFLERLFSPDKAMLTHSAATMDIFYTCLF